LNPIVEKEDVDYLLGFLNYYYLGANITLADVESSWFKLCPLISTNGGLDYNGGDNGKITDDSFTKVVDIVTKYKEKTGDRFVVEDGLITLSGGEITDYRKMAEGALILIQKLLKSKFQKEYTPVDSKTYQVSGGKMDPQKVEETFAELVETGIDKGLTEKEVTYLADLYGANTPLVFSKAKEMKAFPGLGLGESLSLDYAMNEEIAMTPADLNKAINDSDLTELKGER
jgi:alpha-glycerophosphate oxidase